MRSLTYRASALWPIIAIFTLALAMLTVAGCAPTPRGKYAQAETSLGLAADAIRLAVENRKITDRDTLLVLRAALIEGDEQLTKANAALKAGQPTDAEFFANAANDAALHILDFLAQLEPHNDHSR